MIKLKWLCILCACITIVMFTWWSVLVIGVCTIIFYTVKIMLAKYSNSLYTYFEKLFK